MQLADIWSCGVFLYASTIGTYPFYRPQDRGSPKEVQLMVQVIAVVLLQSKVDLQSYLQRPAMPSWSHHDVQIGRHSQVYLKLTGIRILQSQKYRTKQAFLQRILKLQYKIPETGEVTPGLRDILSKILVADPQERLSIREIQQHPWYLQDLPDGVLEMNDELPLPSEDIQVPQHVTDADHNHHREMETMQSTPGLKRYNPEGAYLIR